MPKRFPALLPVVIRGILRDACPSSDGAGTGDLDLDLPATVRYSVVSRLWREGAKKLLFHQIDFTSVRRFVRMRTFIRTSPVTATHVRILSLSIGSNYHTHVQGMEIPDVMNLFPYLHELRLHLDDPPVLTPAIIQQFETTPPIIALPITLSETDQCPDFLLQLLLVPWPLLHLSISRSFAGPVYWMTTEKIREQNAPPWKLIEYRTDGFLEREVLFEWIDPSSLETLTMLHMPPNPQNMPLASVSPRLRSLNLVYDPNATSIFEGMTDYPPFPILQELNLANAILLPGATIYQSAPPSITRVGTTLNTKLQVMLEICPTIPTRIDTVSVYHEGKIATGVETIVMKYKAVDGRFAIKRRKPHTPCMVLFPGRPRDDPIFNKNAMDHAISGRRRMGFSPTSTHAHPVVIISNLQGPFPQSGKAILIVSLFIESPFFPLVVADRQQIHQNRFLQLFILLIISK